MMNNQRRLEILGLLIIAISFFLFISFVGYNANEEPSISPNITIENPMGIFGVFISHVFIKLGFGYISMLIPFCGLIWGWFLFSKKKIDQLFKMTKFFLILIVLTSFTIGTFINYFFSQNKNYLLSGLIGGNLAELFISFFSQLGTFLFIVVSFLVLIRGYFDLNYYKPFENFGNKFRKWRKERDVSIKKKEVEEVKRKHTEVLKEKIKTQIQDDPPNRKYTVEKSNENSENIVDDESVVSQAGNRSIDSTEKNLIDIKLNNLRFNHKDNDSLDDNIEKNKAEENLKIEEIIETEEVDIDDVINRKIPKKKYELPSSDLLATPVAIKDSLNRDELVERANYLTQSMSTFGVQGKVVNVHPGPVITLFEVEPAEGVRVNKFVALADDLARVMEASSVRVIAPIPGKSSVGIEIPNRNPAVVFFKSVVNSPEFTEAESFLTLAIGKTTSGEISTLDLSKMPHLLIAGTTGSGKSVCINTIICSILYRATPDEVKFVMIDPKKVEMTLYKGLEGYHLLKMEDIPEPIVTSVDHAILALKALEKEMDRRYNVLADSVVRNISEFNEKMKDQNNPIMPYIVLVVDELADLMMLSAKDVEAPIARLAQLSRAVGIHLVIATQRPSVDVITGVIKANFPSRIAFQVASKIDSRTIIDQPGADKLIGRGDMLHLGTGSSDVFRMHNAFLSLDEIQSLMNHISKQSKSEEVVLPSVRESQLSDLGGELGETGKDELFNDAISLVITHQQGSISLLQRRLKIGYSRAARLIDEMEQTGVVGPFTGSKAREVLVDETYLEMIRDD